MSQVYSVKKRKRTVGSKESLSKRMRGVPRVERNALVYKRVRPEYKATDVSVVGGSSTTSGTIVSLTVYMAHGTGIQNAYIGSQVDPVSININYTIAGCEASALIALGPDTYNTVRLVVFQWLGDSAPTIADVLQVGSGTSAVYSPLNLDNEDKINMLCDRRHAFYLTNTQVSSGTPYPNSNAITGRIFIPGYKMAPPNFNSAGNATTKNDIYFFHISDSNVAPNPTVSYYARFKYID